MMTRQTGCALAHCANRGGFDVWQQTGSGELSVVRNLAWIGVPVGVAFLVGLFLRFFVPTWIIRLALLAAGAAVIVHGARIMWKSKRPPTTRRRLSIKLPEGAVHILVGGALIAYFVATFWK